MKQIIHDLIEQALVELAKASLIPSELHNKIQVTPSREANQGDFATNIALILAKPCQLAPRDIAQLIVDRLSLTGDLEKVEIAGPGFINFFLASNANQAVIHRILQQDEAFGRSEIGNGSKIQVEFVSANPTGPLHVGHGRGAAFGATLANLLDYVGYQVQREYYVNDAGRQMHILAASTWLRYLELCGESIVFPKNGYQGDYIREIALGLQQDHQTRFQKPAGEVFKDVSEDEPAGDKEKHIDDLIGNAQRLLGEVDYRQVFDRVLNTLIDVIRDDLHEFGVDFDCWFSERSLSDEGMIEQTIDKLQNGGHLYVESGALWFRATSFGDEKDRVVRRENGQTTYFASDIAYHLNKFERGFDKVINVWGSDHHGYVPRVKAALTALGFNPDNLEIEIVQFANLYENGVKVSMSTRSGEFVSLRQLREDVGEDAARFFYVMRKVDHHMDFDLNLAREQSSDNPVFYLQYAYARICSIKRQCEQQGIKPALAEANLQRLNASHEIALIKHLNLYPEKILSAAERREPHLVINYLRDLAIQFHSWYNAMQFIVEDAELRDARIALATAVGQVIKNGLTLIGVSAPEKM